MTLLTAAALLVFIVLGRWQWERGVLKDALASQFAQGGDLVTDLGPQGTRDLPRYTQVRVRGEWMADRQFLLDNRTRDGRAGYEVLTPLQLEDGREVLVNRGWIPFGGRRDQLPDVASGLPSVPVQGAAGVLGVSLGGGGSIATGLPVADRPARSRADSEAHTRGQGIALPPSNHFHEAVNHVQTL